MRKRLFEIIEVSKKTDSISSVYDAVMMLAIIASLVPLAFKQSSALLVAVDRITVALFIIDYALRWITADYKQRRRGLLAFIRHPFTLWAIVDLLSILPSVAALNKGFKTLRVLRLVRALRVLRVAKAMRYSKSIAIIIRVLEQSKEALAAVASLAAGYILVSALIVFCVEPDSFSTFFDAVYWATVSLTTVGYGDIYPVSTAGRVITMASSVFGIAVVALPAGVITAGYMDALQEARQ